MAMDNLQLQYVHALTLPTPVGGDEDDPVLTFCLDSTEEGLLYAATQAGTVLCFEQHGKKLLWSVQLPWEEAPADSTPAAAAAPVVAFAHVVELDALFIAGSNGQLLMLDTASRQPEEVGVVNGGLAAAAWSPNGEQLALLGFNGLLLLMNKEWDVLAEVAVPAPQEGHQLLSARITWRGDSSCLATNTHWGSSSSSSSSSSDNSSSSSSRVLHIWDGETGQLHATGQKAPGLSAAVAWQPNCRHLFAAAALPPPASAAAAAAAAGAAQQQQQQQLRAAPHQRVVSAVKTAPGVTTAAAVAAAAAAASAAQARPDSSWQQHIVLYEKNGLQHGGFDVPTFSSSSSSSDVVIHSLYWSSDSRLLAVVLAPEAALKQQQQQQQQEGGVVPHEWRLQLWCRSNWHWHLKHEQRHELPDVSGGLLVCWDETLPSRLHLMSGAGQYSRLDFGWCLCVSGRGTTAVIDGHQVLLTPMRHGLVPPPMCAVRCLLPRPAVALAWCDGDIEGDLDTWVTQQQQQQTMTMTTALAIRQTNGHSRNSSSSSGDGAAPNGTVAASTAANGTAAAGSDGCVDAAAAAGYCEVLAVLLSDGQLLFFRTAESDLWEETLEDQVALGGPKEYLLPLGYSPAAAVAAVAAAGGSSGDRKALDNDAEYYGGLSIPSGPWSSQYGSAVTAVSTQGGDVQRLQFPPLPAAAAAAGATAGSSGGGGPDIPLAEGRSVLSLVWLGQQRLLLLAAPLEEGLEDGTGTVLIEVSVTLPPSLITAAAAGADSSAKQQQAVETATVRVCYAGGQVLAAAPHPAGGAVLQLAGGKLLYYTNSSSSSSGSNAAASPLLPLPAAACFPCSCPTMLLLPHAPDPTAAAPAAAGSSGGSSGARAAAVRVAAAAPAVGLSGGGVLYWGERVVSSDVTSVAVRGGGPGGPALLYVTRQSVLYMLMVAQLPQYQHTLPDESSGLLTWRPSEFPGELRAAMSTAMRPAAAAAAARDTHMRAVEQGASLLCVPYGGVSAVLVMPRGNLEGICPRLLVLAAITDALDAGAYAHAWGLAVTNRVDLNLLVDYAWPRFLSAAPSFVAAVPSASDLGDLLLALSPASTLAAGGLYANLPQMLGWGPQQQQQQQVSAGAGGVPGPAAGAVGEGDSGGGSGGKVSAVCEAIRGAVLHLPGRFVPLGHLKTVVMSYARAEPPSLEGALAAIRDVKEAAVTHTSSSSSSSTTHHRQQQQQDPVGTAAAAGASSSSAAAGGVSVTPDDLTDTPALSSAADAALKHLLLYVDVDALYAAALGLYDLPLAFMVVSHSQKDPGEYLSELSRFGSIPDPHLQRHAIDTALGRHARALSHLVAAGPSHFNTALKLARDKGLLRQLLALTQQQQQQEEADSVNSVLDGSSGGSGGSGSSSGGGVLSARQRLVAVLGALGDALLASRKAEDAAVAYSAAGLMEQALGAYRSAGAWHMCIVLAARLQHTPAQQQELARDLSEQLLASGAGADAAVLLLQHLGDVDGAVAALITAKEWREGLRVAYAHGRPDLVDTDLVPAAAQAASVLLSDANEAIERLNKYMCRLVEVRARRSAMAAALAAAEAEAAADADGGAAVGGAAAGAALDQDDLISEGPSMISGFSIYTDRTATAGFGGSSAASSSAAASTVGGRRPMRAAKKGKKGRRIKQGGPEEEAGLEAHLLTLAPARHVLEEAGQLSELLVMLQHIGDATKLQQRVGQWQAAAAEAAALVAQGQQQQQQPSGGAQAQAKAGAAAAAAAASAVEVHWKWDVLREHKTAE